jgi:hypothetical protein
MGVTPAVCNYNNALIANSRCDLEGSAEDILKRHPEFIRYHALSPGLEDRSDSFLLSL